MSRERAQADGQGLQLANMSMTRRQFVAAALVAASSARRAWAQAKRVRTIAGTGTAGSQPDAAEAASAAINNPYGVVIGPDGALYFCEVDTGRTRRLDLSARRLTTIAGNGQKAYVGDGGSASAASFSAPHEIRFDADRNLFVVERDAHVVRRIDAKTGVVSTFAGTGAAGFSGDGGPAARAQFRQPHSIAFDASGNLLVCDIQNARIRAVNLKSGIISTYAGTGERAATPDEGPLEGAALNGPRSIDTDGDGNVYLALREGNAVFKIDRQTRRLSRIAGTGETGYSGDGGPARAARLSGPKGIVYSPDGSVFIADTESHTIRRIDLKSGIITTVLGTGTRGDGPDGDPLRCALARPHGLFLYRGALYVSDSENHRIRILE
jgi:DNA-binding beta-propeller fold protein YncE